MENYPLTEMNSNSRYTPDLSYSAVMVENGVKEISVVPSKSKLTWKAAWLDFSQNTTFHGLRYIWLQDAFVMRRLFWLLLVIGCGGLLAFQLIDRIIYYYDWPVTVNVHVNFNKTLIFPSVTLCNQNTFRSTQATMLNRYRLVEKMFTSSSNLTLDTLKMYNSSNVTLDEFYQQMSHTKHDLIVRCEWQNEPCGPENFTEVLTDHGVCYSFNHLQEEALRVISTGSDYGLKLTLNVEQYEYMPGPHTAAGVKLLFHDQKEFPRVNELGLAIPTGAHAFIGIQLVSIANLPKPHGNCGEKKSEYYKQYSQDTCKMACMTQYMDELCGCRHHFMPSLTGKPPICTLEQYVGCYLNKIEEVKTRIQRECDCPVPCRFLIYDPSLSFAATSSYATDRLLAFSSNSNLENQFHRARETTSRMDQLKFGRFSRLEQDVREKLVRLKQVMVGDVEAMIGKQEAILEELFNETDEVVNTKDFLYRYQLFMIEKNFARARDAMEERTLNYLAMGFQEFSYQVSAKIKQLMDPNFQDASTRQTLYILTANQINGRIDLAERAFDNYTQLYNSYFTGQPIFRYRFELEPREDNIIIIPKPLLSNSLNHSDYAQLFSARVGNDIELFKSRLQNISTILDNAYYNHSLNETELHIACVLFLHSGRRFYHSKSTFYYESIDYPKRIMLQRISNFILLNRTYQAVANSLKNHLSSLVNSIENLKTSLIQDLEEGLNLANNFIKFGNVTKMTVAQEMTSDTIYAGISNLKVFFQDIRSRGQSVFDDWSLLAKAVSEIWKEVILDEDMLEYYENKSMSLYTRNFTSVKADIEQTFHSNRVVYDFRSPVGNTESMFLKSLDDLMKHLKQYIEDADIDSDFIKENFLQLDVFYREKSYEEITQQIGYDTFALFCDFGGSMGLFVGASVLTVFELFDLIIHQLLRNTSAK